MPDDTDANATDLAAWTQQGDQAAFGRLVERHQRLVSAACRRQLGPGPAADEAAQAVFIILARRAGSVSPPRALATWLYGVARGVCRNARRAATARSFHERMAAMLSRPEGPAGEPPAWAELRPLLDDALATLDQADRDAVIGHYLEGLPQSAVAIRLGISENAVQKRIARSVDRLRAWFGRRGAAVTAALLIAGMSSESGAAEPGLVAACTQAGLHPSGAGAAAAMAASSGGGLSWWIAASIAVSALLAGGGAWLALRDAPPQPAGPVLRFDFEPADLDPRWTLGRRAADPDSRPGSIGCLVGAGGPWCQVRLETPEDGPALLPFSDDLELRFDYWVDPQIRSLDIYAWNRTQQAVFGDLHLMDLQPQAWTRAVLPLRNLRRTSTRHDAPAPRDLLGQCTIQAGQEGGLIRIDNLELGPAVRADGF